MPAFPDHDDHRGWVRLLADPIRSQRAFWHLVLSGPDALDSVQAGLDSPNADVRRWSTKAMEHLIDAHGLATLVRMLDDPDPVFESRLATPLRVIDAKDNACRPDVAAVLPRAIAVMLDDPDAHVRAYAVELVGALGAHAL